MDSVIQILGVFEDAAQRDFHLGLLDGYGRAHAVSLQVEPRLTHGCRFDVLAEALNLAAYCHGVIIGVDGKKLKRSEKVDAMLAGAQKHIGGQLPRPILWSVARPSVEEWLMADVQALPLALQEAFGLPNVPAVQRPGKPGAERTAKQRLRAWAEALCGDTLLRGGLEYARETGERISVDRVGRKRNPDLLELLQSKLPRFLIACRE